MAVFKLTEATVKALLFAEDGQQFFYDSVLRGFGVRISGKTKSFIAERRVKGRSKRITIGTYPHLSVDKARRTAQIILGELAQGIDRKAIERSARIRAVTLSETFEEFKKARKSMIPQTLIDYERNFNRLLADWMKCPWVSITPQAVLKRHAEIGERNGPAAANQLMKALAAVLRFAMKYYKDTEGKSLIFECPTTILSDANAWFPTQPKDSYIKPNQLKGWWDAVNKLENRTMRDYLLLVLLTGLRRSEAASLRWGSVDLENKTITIERTKNKKKHMLPLTDFLWDMLKRRQQESGSDYVFSGSGKTGYVNDIDRNVRKIQEATKSRFSLHDLRRTFVTIAESLDISSYAVKRMVNHSMRGDVTATHYIVFDIERLRDPMEKINWYILRHAGVLPHADVVPLPVSSNQAVA